AITVCRSVSARHPNHAGARRLMTVSLGLLGRIDEAKESLASTLALQPDFSTDHVAYNTVFVDASDRSRFLRGLKRAGLPNERFFIQRGLHADGGRTKRSPARSLER